MLLKRFSMVTACIAMFILIAIAASAQNTISGEITGTVTDTSGAVVPNASVQLTNKDMGVHIQTVTSSAGSYRFALLRPGTYQLATNSAGFGKVTRNVVVSLGQVTNAPLQLAVQGSQEVINVTTETPLLQTENGNLATTYDAKQLDLLPSPGQDITNYAMTSPGVTLSTGAGFGNFTANGMPGTSNLYTVNGNDYNDPYLNLNNSGASNLLLGVNELQEISIVTNGYTGEYGRMAGANVNYTTKTGSNKFHGNASYFWNGRSLNANDWFNNNSGTPIPFSNSNQWAGAIGGPIKKDKLYFFYDNEGLRYVLPGGGLVFVPSAQFQAATLANLATANPSVLPFYKTIFGLYNGAPGISRATPVTTGVDATLGCGDIADPVLGVTQPCASTFRSTVNNLNVERLQSLRIDYNLNQNNKFNFRYKQDRGVQATGTDPINSAFNANSVQPEDDGQMTWTHIINDHTVNQFIASGLYYSALFGPPNIKAALAVFPTTIAFVGDGLFNNMGGTDSNYPQGRNVTQYQFVDDFSWTRGNHGIKFGVNYRKNDISSFASGPLTSGQVSVNSMTDFFNGAVTGGGGSTFTQRFANAQEQPIAYYSLGLYLQDEWRVNNKLKLTLALRADRNSNENCRSNCFARPAGSFAALDHTATIPYNQAIQTGLSQAFPGLEKIAWGPRVGFAWTPFGGTNTVLRGGFGLFSDLYPGFLADRFITNLPNVTSFTLGAGCATNAACPIAPGVPNSVFSQAAANDAALRSAFTNGGTNASIKAALPTFTNPNVNVIDNVSNPKYLEWNFEIEQAIGQKTSLTVNYVGNHGYKLFIANSGLNTFCTVAKCPTGFDGLPTAAPDSRFGIVTQAGNTGRSNYDGLTTTLARKFTKGFSANVNYTWAHSLDDLSNGGLLPYSTNNGSDSLRVQIDPNNLDRLNYGSSDYDFRHSFSANYYWEFPFKASNAFLDRAIGGWSVSGTFFARSAEPFSVYNTSTASRVLGNGTSDRVLAFFNGGAGGDCSHPAFDPLNPIQCVSPSQFATRPSPTNGQPFTFGNISRNHFRGPNYFNADFSVQKNFKTTENGPVLTFGANAFNVFNHPNFANPSGSLTAGTFGQIVSTVVPPNSPYGNFQGSTFGRILQLDVKVRF